MEACESRNASQTTSAFARPRHPCCESFSLELRGYEWFMDMAYTGTVGYCYGKEKSRVVEKGAHAAEKPVVLVEVGEGMKNDIYTYG